MLTSATYNGKHCAPRKSIVRAACKRYAEAHKPIHVFVVCLFAAVEFAALFLTHEFFIHMGITSVITTWELAIIAMAE